MKRMPKMPMAMAVAMLAACGNNSTAQDNGSAQNVVTTDDISDEPDDEEGTKSSLNISTYVEEAPAEGGASCVTDYGFQYDVSLELLAQLLPLPRAIWDSQWSAEPVKTWGDSDNGQIDYPEDDPAGYWGMLINTGRTKASTTLTMPGYTDTLPLFDRAKDWVDGEERCYMTSTEDVFNLNQDEAYDLYVKIAEKTVGVTLNQTAGRRNVVGIRGAHPGQFFFNGDLPNRFNDTIVLLWIDEEGQKHVREFPVNTNTGIQKSSSTKASALPANRHYRYVNGLHKGYNALKNNEYNYITRDDANNNSHIDNDRNGWFKPTTGTQDYDRTGSGHNIHYGKATNLKTSPVSNWSAGCQVIPGMKNWTTFISKAWTGSGKFVDYYLVDVRDIDNRVWDDTCIEDGTHSCPFHITFENNTFTDSNTLMAGDGSADWDSYNCAATKDESGPGRVYVFTWDDSGAAKKTLTVKVSSSDGGDPDIMLLDGDDPNSCIVRNDKTISKSITPGRYYIVVDTYVSNGNIKYGSYDLEVTLK